MFLVDDGVSVEAVQPRPVAGLAGFTGPAEGHAVTVHTEGSVETTCGVGGDEVRGTRIQTETKLNANHSGLKATKQAGRRERLRVVWQVWQVSSAPAPYIHTRCVYSQTAAGERHRVAVRPPAAEAGPLRVLARGGRVPRVRHVRAVHGPLAVPGDGGGGEGDKRHVKLLV